MQLNSLTPRRQKLFRRGTHRRVHDEFTTGSRARNQRTRSSSVATGEIVCAGLRRFDVGHDLSERLVNLSGRQHVFENQRSIALNEAYDLVNIALGIESGQFGH